MGHLLRDLRYGLRQLRREPGFTAVAIAVLALGIGATTAIFTVLHEVVLRPLPYFESEQLVYIDVEMPGEESNTSWGVTEAGYFHLRDNQRAFQEIGAYGGAETGHELTIVGPEGGTRVSAAWVSFSLLDVLGARPHLGRLIREEDDGWMRPGGPGTLSGVVLGHDFWLREFGGDPEVIGQTLRLEGDLSLEVLGVLEPGFQMPHGRVDVWLPLGLHPSGQPNSFHGYWVVGRLATGNSIEDAASDLERLAAQLPRAIPSVYTPEFMRESQFRLRVTPLRARVLAGVDEVLWILFGSVGLLLLIAYANVTNLFLVRSDARRHDQAIRQALGIGRVGLVRQRLCETIVLVLIACAVGIWIGGGALRLFLVLVPTELPRLEGLSIGSTSLAAAGMSALVGWLVLVVALLLAGSVGISALREGGTGRSIATSRQRARGAMVVAQVALSLVLLVGAGVMYRSFERLSAVDPGFEAANLLVMDLHPPANQRYLQSAEVQQLYRDLLSDVAGLPGVQQVSAGGVPMTFDPLCLPAHVEDRPLGPGQVAPCVKQLTVAPGFFETMGIPLRGRDVAWTDPERGVEPWAGGEVVVTPALADRLWPGEDPLGKGIRLRVSGAPWARVVGVTGELYGDGLNRPPAELVFGQLWLRPSTLVIRLAPEGSGGVPGAVRAIISDLDPAIAIGRVRTMEEAIAATPAMARTTLTLLLLGVGAVTGLLLSGIGLFGVVAYLVGLRRTEIGIRMALGAPVQRVTSMVLTDGLKLAAVGAALGFLGAVSATRLLESLLFEVSPFDPVTFVFAIPTVLLVALLATWLPARRASRVDPMLALRAD